MWYLKIDTLLLMLGAAALFALGSWLCMRYRPETKLTPWILVLDLGILCYVSCSLAIFYVTYTLLSWFLVQWIRKINRGRQFWFVCFCILDILPFLYVRMAGFFPELPDLFVLIGFSYNMLKAVDAVFFTYYTDEKIPLDVYANYMLFFPVITAGPIFRYRDFQRFYRKPQSPTWARTESCIKRFILGMFKKLVLAVIAMQCLHYVLGMPSHWYVSITLAVLSYAVLYFDMSGYSDIAIAVSTVMGIPAPENFKQPWTAASFTQFWRKWHVTLSDWIREHIFVVLNGKRLNKYLSACIGMGTMLVMSAWHNFELLTLCSGLYMGTFLAIENIFGITTADKRKINKFVFHARCLLISGLFAINAMCFTMNEAQLLQAIRGFFVL